MVSESRGDMAPERRGEARPVWPRPLALGPESRGDGRRSCSRRSIAACSRVCAGCGSSGAAGMGIDFATRVIRWGLVVASSTGRSPASDIASITSLLRDWMRARRAARIAAVGRRVARGDIIWIGVEPPEKLPRGDAGPTGARGERVLFMKPGARGERGSAVRSRAGSRRGDMPPPPIWCRIIWGGGALWRGDVERGDAAILLPSLLR